MCASETRINTFQYCQIFTLSHTPVFKEYRFKLTRERACVRFRNSTESFSDFEHTSNLLKLKTKTDRIHPQTAIILKKQPFDLLLSFPMNQFKFAT